MANANAVDLLGQATIEESIGAAVLARMLWISARSSTGVSLSACIAHPSISSDWKSSSAYAVTA